MGDMDLLAAHEQMGGKQATLSWNCGGAQSLRAEVGLSEENCQYRDSPSIFHKTLWRRLVDKALRQLAKSNHARDRSPGWYSQPATCCSPRWSGRSSRSCNRRSPRPRQSNRISAFVSKATCASI